MSGEPWSCAGAGSADVWFQYDAVTTGFDLELCLNGDYLQLVEVYTGPCGALTLVNCGEARCYSQWLIIPHVVAGTRYTIRIGGRLERRGEGWLLIKERNAAPPAPGPACFQSYFAAENGTADGGVIFFDVETLDPLVIAGLELNTSSTGAIGLEVWTVPGGYSGNASNPAGAGWTHAASDDGQALGLGQDMPSSVNFARPWLLPAGTWGVALIGRNAQSGATLRHAYSNGTPFNMHYTSGDRLTQMHAGVAADVPWSGALSPPAVWNGRFCYSYVTLGTNYCVAAINATGLTGSITASGSVDVAQNNLMLHADHLSTQAFCYFLTSRTQGFIANPGVSVGNLCLGGAIGRFLGPGQIQHTGASGTASLAPDLTQFPTPTGPVAVNVGETWNFTLWHREVFGHASSNFTNGLEVLFE